MEKNERLKTAYQYLKGRGVVHTQKDLAEKMGATPPNVSSAFNGVESVLTDKFLYRFNNAFDDIFNIDWLLCEKGEMLKQKNEASPRTLDVIVGIPLVSQYAYAGYLSGYGDPEYMASLPKIDFTPDRHMTGNYVAFEVRGDSMNDGSADSYLEGELLICREVEPYHWKDNQLYINKRDFVIIHKDGILIKRIIAHDVENHKITIHSLNPMYSDEILDLADVKQIFSVVESRRQRRRL